MKILFIDKDQSRLETFLKTVDPGHVIHWANGLTQAIAELEGKTTWDLVMLDYDFSADVGTEIINLLPKAIKSRQFNSVFICHSMTPAGNIAMFRALIEKGYRTIPIPFGAMIVELKYNRPLDGAIIKGFYHKIVQMASSNMLEGLCHGKGQI